jgi:hypothetical protein
MKTLGKLAQSVLERCGLEVRRVHSVDGTRYSNLDEESCIRKYLAQLGSAQGFCVDIAASDGVAMSNTFRLFQQSWKGLAVEYDPEKFARLARTYVRFPDVQLAKCKVTPQNVLALLETCEVPRTFEFLNLDIDSYDYFVLEQMLQEFRPSLICAEINEKIPPPIKFTVLYRPDHAWAEDHFYGQSISQLHELCLRFGYSLVELHYNNAFLIPEELSTNASLTPEAAYQSGYLLKPDRKSKFPWNANMEEVLTLPPAQAVEFVDRYFGQYRGRFRCSL